MHFTGESSGIVLNKLVHDTSKDFSVLIQFRSENLTSTDKRILFVDANDDFASESIASRGQLSSRMNPNSEISESDYCPCLFTFVSRSEMKEFKLHIALRNRKRVIFFECKILEKIPS